MATSAGHVAEAITGNGGTAASWTLDVTDGDDVARVVADVQRQLGPIDILVNNAGIAIPVEFPGDSFDDAWEQTLDVNLRAHTRLIRACLPDLRRNGDGRVDQHRLHGGDRGHRLQLAVRRRQARRHRPHTRPRRRARFDRRDVQLRLPGPDPHGYDVGDP